MDFSHKWRFEAVVTDEIALFFDWFQSQMLFLLFVTDEIAIFRPRMYGNEKKAFIFSLTFVYAINCD